MAFAFNKDNLELVEKLMLNNAQGEAIIKDLLYIAKMQDKKINPDAIEYIAEFLNVSKMLVLEAFLSNPLFCKKSDKHFDRFCNSQKYLAGELINSINKVDYPNYESLTLGTELAVLDKLLKKYQKEDILSNIENSNIFDSVSNDYVYNVLKQSPKGEKKLVVNITDYFFGAPKEQYLIRMHAIDILAGTIICCILGLCKEAVFYIRYDFEKEIQILNTLIDKLKSEKIFEKYGLKGFKIVKNYNEQHVFSLSNIAGAIEGKSIKNRPTVEYPDIKINGVPAMIFSLETLFEVIFSFTQEGKNKKLLTVIGDVKQPSIVRYDREGSLLNLIEEHCRGFKKGGDNLLCVLIGGLKSAIINKQTALRIDLDRYSLQNSGCVLGNGVIIVVNNSKHPIDLALALVNIYDRYVVYECSACKESVSIIHNYLNKMKERDIFHQEYNNFFDAFNVIKKSNSCEFLSYVINMMEIIFKNFDKEIKKYIYT